MVSREVATRFGLTPGDLDGRSRIQPRADARFVAMYVLRHVTGGTYGAIGQAFGIKNHTSVLHGCDKVRKMRGQDPELDGFIDDLIIRAKRG